MNKVIIASMVFLMTANVSFAETKEVKPTCTASNSFLEVLFGSCNLIKGDKIYGELPSAFDPSSMSPSVGGTGGGSG